MLYEQFINNIFHQICDRCGKPVREQIPQSHPLTVQDCLAIFQNELEKANAKENDIVPADVGNLEDVD
jgi:hypothetical protein